MMRLRVLGAWLAFGLLALAPAAPGHADQLVVRRHVTLREGPARTTAVVAFPPVGSTLELLDDGRRVRGYYHARLPDGRTGWIYQSFVGRVADPAPSPSGAPDMAVHYIDIDQGAAALLEFACGAVMIDAGGRGGAASDALIAYLEAFFARRTDLQRRLAAVFVTHTHVDHNSNLRRVAETFRVGGYVHNGVPNGSGRHGAAWMATHVQAAQPAIPAVAVSSAMVAAAGGQGLSDAVIDPVQCAGVDPAIRVLAGRHDDNPGWPDGEFENGNNHSLVVRVDFGSASFLFTGDTEETALETLVERYAGTGLLDIDVYLAGHHGSYNGTNAALLAAMSPSTAVISMGPASVRERWTAWAYGHPRRRLVEMLARSVSGRRPAPARVLVADRIKTFTPYDLSGAVYATGWDGHVVVRATANGVTGIETQR